MDIDILLILTIQFLFPFEENLLTDDDNNRTVIEAEILLDCFSDHEKGTITRGVPHLHVNRPLVVISHTV